MFFTKFQVLLGVNRGKLENQNMWSDPSPSYKETGFDNAPVEVGNPPALNFEISALI